VLDTLESLLARRGSDRAEAALDRWVDAITESSDVFVASAAHLAEQRPDGFTRGERWMLLSIMAEVADDSVLGDACEALEARMEEEARSIPGFDPDTADDVAMRQESPYYRVLSDAWSSMRLAIETTFLRDIGMADMARAMIDDDGSWERTLRDAEATLLGIPRIVLTAEDDPYGILLP
jgi:hypothetical protein